MSSAPSTLTWTVTGIVRPLGWTTSSSPPAIGADHDTRIECAGGETVTSNVADAALPDASVAVQVTVVVPTGNTEPDAGSHATTGPGSTSSTAVGSTHVTTAPAASSASTEMPDGTPESTGGVVSAAGGSTTSSVSVTDVNPLIPVEGLRPNRIV